MFFLLVFSRSGDCTYDYLKAWETDLRERRPQKDLGTFCGSNHPGLIHTNLDVLNIEFLSDSSIAGNGFRLEWVVDGCGGYLRKDSGTFTSPEYPNFYPVNVICEWRIETDPGTKVQIVINELDLEGKNSKLKIPLKIHINYFIHLK